MALKGRRLTIVNFSDLGGGAEGVVWSLFEGLRLRGVDAQLLVGLKRRGDHPAVREIPIAASPIGRLFEGAWRGLDSIKRDSRAMMLVGRVLKALAAPSVIPSWWRGQDVLPWPGSRLIAGVAQGSHIIHLHNLHGGYLDISILPRLGRTAKLVITLHDEWIYTGHCAHPMECQKWKFGCGHCPDLRRYPGIHRDFTSGNLLQKERVMEACRPHLVTLCQWSRDRLLESSIPHTKTWVIHNGVDTEVFRPMGRGGSKMSLKRGGHTLTLLYISPRGRSYKGAGLPLEVLKEIRRRINPLSLRVLVIGEGKPPSVQLDGAVAQGIPWIDDPRELASVYDEADIYIHQSMADTFPLSVLESMSCGTPVLAPTIGGIPEQIADRHTGMLFEPGDLRGLIEAIEWLSRESQRIRQMGVNGVQRVRELFSLEKMIEDHLDLYQGILGKNR
jgi:glycosyltransferase involved in cell wall biosynthesis